MRVFSFVKETVRDAARTATSKKRIQGFFHIPLYSNAFYLTVASGANVLLSLAFWRIVAKHYSEGDVGLAAGLITAMGLVAALSELGLGTALIRFLPHSGDDAKSMINTALTIGVSACAIAAFIFVAGIGFWSPDLLFLRQDPAYFAVFVAAVIAYQIWYLMNQIFIAKRRAGFSAGQTLIFSVLRLPLPLFLVGWSHAYGIFTSWGIALGVAVVSGMCFFMPRVQSGYRPFFAANMRVVRLRMSYALGNHVSILFWFVPGLTLPIVVLNMLGKEPTAHFYMAWTIGTMLPLITGAALTSLMAEGSHEEESLSLNTRRSLKVVFVMLSPAVLLIVAFAPQVLLLFGSSYSESAAMLLRLLAISAIPTAINLTFINIKRVEKKLGVLVVSTALLSTATLGLACLLLPSMGINGVGVAVLVSQSILALIVVPSLFKGTTAITPVENEPIYPETVARL